MGKHTKSWNAMSLILFLIVFVLSLVVFFLTRTGEGYADLAINLIFDVVALIFIACYFIGCARPLARTTAALSRVGNEILHTEGDPRTLWKIFGQDEGLFHIRRLDERYGAYVRETRRLQEQNAATADCSIQDYLDDELLYSTVNKPFCDQLGGLMSGLGILFTFIGLVYGLRNFDASSVDVMQTSTQALMAGIKIAFMTSIFGLIYSLLFGLSYKKLMKDSIDTLYEFQDIYTEAVQPNNEHAAENAIIRLQMEQNATLTDLGNSIGTQISESIVSLLQPTVDQLQMTISQYITLAIEDQRSGMEKIVRYFMDSMNDSLGNIFAQLRSRTEELTRWEKDTIDGFANMSASIARAGQDLVQAQADAQRISDTMSSYTTTIDALTAAQTSVIKDMKTFMDDYSRLHEREDACIRSFAAAAEDAVRNTEQSLQVASAVSAIADKMQTTSVDGAQEIALAGQKVSQAAADVRAMSDTIATDMNAAAARLERSARDLEDNLTRSVEDSVTILDESLMKLAGGLNGITGAANQTAQTMRTLPKTVSSVETDVKATVKSIDGELKFLLKAVSDTEELLNKFNDELSRRVAR